MAFYGLAAALWVVSLISVGSVYYSKGSASRNSEIAEYQAAIATSENIARAAEAKAEKARATVITEYKERVKVIREQIPGEIQLVEVIKRDSTCLAPPSFRVLHDSAASGNPAPKDSTGTDAAPVPVEDIAATVADNYRTARENAARLSALQSYLSKIEEAEPVTK